MKQCCYHTLEIQISSTESRVSMHKLADSKKANKHVHKENQTGRLKGDEKGVSRSCELLC